MEERRVRHGSRTTRTSNRHGSVAVALLGVAACIIVALSARTRRRCSPSAGRWLYWTALLFALGIVCLHLPPAASAGTIIDANAGCCAITCNDGDPSNACVLVPDGLACRFACADNCQNSAGCDSQAFTQCPPGQMPAGCSDTCQPLCVPIPCCCTCENSLCPPSCNVANNAMDCEGICEASLCGAAIPCPDPRSGANCSFDTVSCIEAVSTAPAPAISRNGVLLALALLVGIGGVAVLRRRRGA